MARPIVAGVYLLRCDYDDRVYVGSSKDIHKRHSSHVGFLRRRIHANANLQEIADQYGPDCLSVEVIEECGEDVLRAREQFHLDRLKKSPGGVFNISDYTDCSMRGRSGKLNPFFGKTHSESVRQRLSKIATGRTMPDEVRRKMSETHKGMPRPWRAGKPYVSVRCIDTGEVFESVCAAARAYGRGNPSGIYSVLAGRQKKAYGVRWEAVAENNQHSMA